MQHTEETLFKEHHFSGFCLLTLAMAINAAS
jgi:hypothetical protein